MFASGDASKLRRRTTSTCAEITEAEVKVLVDRDPVAFDLVLSVFSSALASYRCDTLIRPFPNHFRNNDDEKEPDFQWLRECMSRVPPVADIIKPDTRLDKDVIVLLGWLLQQPNLHFKTCKIEKYEEIEGQSGPSSYSIRPDFIFEHVPTENKRQSDFQDLGQKHGVLTAYHGSALENFHSILMNGFLNHFNTTALFGEGTYLSSDITVCMGFSRPGKSWDKSAMGARLTCIAVCEVVKHPDVTLPGGAIPTDIDRASTVGGDKAPDTYVVVPNNDHLRLKHVYVYREEAAPEAMPKRSRGCCGGLRSIVSRHRFTITMLCYFFGLVMVGLWNNRNFRKWVYRKLK